MIFYLSCNDPWILHQPPKPSMKYLLATLCLSLAFYSAMCQSPVFNPSFGTGDQVIINNRYCSNNEILTTGQMAFTPDGKILLSFGSGYGVARVLTNGQPDSSFGVNGFVNYFPGGTDNMMVTMLAQPDGKIMLGGVDAATKNIQLMRLQANGSPDSSFHDAGLLQFEIEGLPTPPVFADVLLKVLLTADGKYLVFGTQSFTQSVNGPNQTFPVVARLNQDGSIDGTFGKGGRIALTSDLIAANNFVGVGLHGDGSMTIMGSVQLTNLSSPTLYQTARLTAAGLPDSSFGINGILTQPTHTDFNCARLIGLPDGRYYTLSSDSAANYSITRFLHNGEPDSSFGVNGSTTNFPNYFIGQLPQMDTIPGSSNLLMRGYMTDEDTSQYLSELTAAGQPDAGFGQGGFSIIPNFTALPNLHQSVAEPNGYDGNIYVAGNTSSTINTGEVTFQRCNATGTFDPSLGGNGITAFSHGGSDDDVEAVGVTTDKKIIVAGHSLGCSTWQAEQGMYINRLLPGGIPDSTFGTNGSIQWDATAAGGNILFNINGLAMQPDNSFLLIGTTYNGAIYVQKRLANGLVDSTFAVNGLYQQPLQYEEGVISFWNSLIVQPDGNILFLGSMAGPGTNGPIIGRLTPQGNPDPGFGSNGVVQYPAANNLYSGFQAMALRPNGQIVIAYSTTDTITVMQLNANGSIDNSFGSNGQYKFILQPSAAFAKSVAIQPDGKIVVLYNYNTYYNNGSYDNSPALGIFRLMPTGSPDTGFVNNTISISENMDANQLMLQNDGRILIPCYTSSLDSSNDDAPTVVLVRLRPDGRPDATFAPGGAIPLMGHSAYYEDPIDPVGSSPRPPYLPVLLTRQDSTDYILSATVQGLGKDGWLTSFYAKDSILPADGDTTSITLTDTASACHTIRLAWIAANDTASQYFSVQRSSAYGYPFTQIATVLPASHVKGRVEYYYTDSLPLQGGNVYRIQMVMGGDSTLNSNTQYAALNTALPGTVVNMAVYLNGSPGAYFNSIAWSIQQQQPLDSIDILRKDNSGPFTTIGQVRPLPAAAVEGYSYFDQDSALTGHIYTYQIALYGSNCLTALSGTISDTIPAKSGDTTSTAIPPPLPPPGNIDTLTTVKIYPNPGHSLIQLGLPATFTTGTIQIVSGEGTPVLQEEITQQGNGVSSINVSRLAPGIYFIKIISPEKVWRVTFLKL